MSERFNPVEDNKLTSMDDQLWRLDGISGFISFAAISF